MENPSAKLTYTTDVGLGKSTRIIKIYAVGPPPEEAKLTDETGTLVVDVVAVDGSACEGKPQLATTLGSDVWCLQLSGIATGQPITGTIEGAAATLELTIKARHHWGNPTLFAIAMLALAVLLVWLSTTLVPSFVSWARLRWQQGSDGEIEGLSAWATEAQKRKLSGSDVLSRMRWAKKHGPSRVLAHRQALGELHGTGVLAGSPLAEAAHRESVTQTVDVVDVLTADGDIAVSAAERLLSSYREAAALHEEFSALAAQMIAQITNQSDRTVALSAQDEIADHHVGFLTPRTVKPWTGHLETQLAVIRGLVPAAPGLGPTVGTAAYAASPTSPPTALRRVTDAVSFGGATAAALVVGLILMAVAVAIVLVGSYLPNETFGTRDDYLTLAAAAIGSAGAAGIVTYALLLRAPNSWNA